MVWVYTTPLSKSVRNMESVPDTFRTKKFTCMGPGCDDEDNTTGTNPPHNHMRHRRRLGMMVIRTAVGSQHQVPIQPALDPVLSRQTQRPTGRILKHGTQQSSGRHNNNNNNTNNGGDHHTKPKDAYVEVTKLVVGVMLRGGP